MKKVVLVLIVGFLLLLAPKNVLAATISISNPTGDDNETTIDIGVSGLASNSCPNTQCFLQGMITKPTSNPSYFGFTKNNSDQWIKYIGSPDSGYIKTNFFSFTPVSGSWSGQIKVKNDHDDSSYQGPGDYILRVRRYTGNSSSSTTETSNDLGITLAYATPTPTPTPSPSPTASPTSVPTATATPMPSRTASPISTPLKTSVPTLVALASLEPTVTPFILGESTEVPIPTLSPIPTATSMPIPKEKKAGFPFLIAGSGVVGIIFVGFAFWPFIKMQLKRYNIMRNAKKDS